MIGFLSFLLGFALGYFIAHERAWIRGWLQGRLEHFQLLSPPVYFQSPNFWEEILNDKRNQPRT